VWSNARLLLAIAIAAVLSLRPEQDQAAAVALPDDRRKRITPG
jgi:hypothetical protein